MDRSCRAGHQATFKILVGLVFIMGIGLSAPEATALQFLYVGNDQTPGGVQQYTLPISGTSTPNFTIAANDVLAVAQDANGSLAVGELGGNLKFFTAPLSAGSTPSATFPNGMGGSGQIVFTPAGDFFVATVSNKVNRFTPPFSNASTPSQTITNAGLVLAIGVALDAAQNLYISNDGAGPGSNLFVYAPPYTGAPIITPVVAGTAYRKVAISGTQLFVDSVAGTTGRVDVYNLPITAASAPAFSITNGVNLPEGVALDAGGNLYIGNLANATVTVYNPPFSAASAPTTTLTAGAGAFAIFGIAIGNAVGVAAGIPTLGPVGLIALCALLLVIGLAAVRVRVRT